MSSLPITSVDNIISYLAPVEKMKISPKYKFIAIMESKEKIRKVVAKWVVGYRDNMDVDYYRIPKNIYKKYYPLMYRMSFIEQVLDLLAPCDDRYIIVSSYASSEGLVSAFNKTVDLLSEDELFIVGW